MGFLSRTISAPLYVQIHDKLREDMENGVYRVGDKLPSERELCESFGVSRIPVRQALELLESEGRIQSFQGKGSFVLAPRLHNRLVHIQSFSETLAQQGYTGCTRILSFDAHNSDHSMDMILGGGRTGTSRLTLLGYANGEPVVFYDSHLRKPEALRFHQAALAAEAAGEAFSTFDLYSRTMTSIGDVDQRVMAVNADAHISSVLGIPEQTAVLVLETVIRNSSGEAVEFKRGYYRTDKYSFNLYRSI